MLFPAMQSYTHLRSLIPSAVSYLWIGADSRADRAVCLRVRFLGLPRPRCFRTSAIPAARKAWINDAFDKSGSGTAFCPSRCKRRAVGVRVMKPREPWNRRGLRLNRRRKRRANAVRLTGLKYDFRTAGNNAIFITPVGSSHVILQVIENRAESSPQCRMLPTQPVKGVVISCSINNPFCPQEGRTALPTRRNTIFIRSFYR